MISDMLSLVCHFLSDDGMVKVWDPFERRLLRTFEPGHQANIFGARFLTNSGDTKLVSCDAAGLIRLVDVERNVKSRFTCNGGVTFEVVPDPLSPHLFFSCGEDGTVRMFDLRLKQACNCNMCEENVVVKLEDARQRRIGITALCFHPSNPVFFSVGCWDSSVRTFDRRMTKMDRPVYQITPSFLQRKKLYPGTAVLREDSDGGFKITSLCYNHDGSELLVSYSNENVYLIRPNSPHDAGHYMMDESSRLGGENLSFVC